MPPEILYKTPDEMPYEVRIRYEADLMALKRRLAGQLRPEDVREFEDDERFCREALVVQNKEGRIIPAEWGLGQRRFFEAAKKQRSAGKPVRIIVLKPRQAFISTGVAMYNFKKTPFYGGQSTLVVAHDDDSSKKIFEYYKRFQQNYKGFHGLALPKLITPKNLDNPDQEIMKWANGSFVQVETANNVKGGRSWTVRNLHLSEYAFYARPKEFLTGVMQSVPDDIDSSIVIESTANGMGGAFYDEWNRAVDGKSDFVPVFIAFYEHEEYQRPLDVSRETFFKSLDKDEQKLLHEYRVTLECLNWRRWAIANKCQGDENVFRQEFPSNPEEAFITSGRPRFRPVYVRRHVAQEPKARGELRYEEIGRRLQMVFQENEHGALWVWDTPDPHRDYVIGIDTAEGIDANEGMGTPDPDYTVADVFETAIRVQVAQLRERLTPDEAGRYVYDLGKWYNWAYLVPEVDGIGQAMLAVLVTLGYPTDRIYHRVVYDEEGRARSKKMGFKTGGSGNREILLSAYESGLAGHGDSGIIVRSAVSIREAYGFKIKPGGKAEAEVGQHDDTVFSGGLVAIGLRDLPRVRPNAPVGQRQTVTRYGQWKDPAEAERRAKLARM